MTCNTKYFMTQSAMRYCVARCATRRSLRTSDFFSLHSFLCSLGRGRAKQKIHPIFIVILTKRPSLISLHERARARARARRARERQPGEKGASQPRITPPTDVARTASAAAPELVLAAPQPLLLSSPSPTLVPGEARGATETNEDRSFEERTRTRHAHVLRSTTLPVVPVWDLGWDRLGVCRMPTNANCYEATRGNRAKSRIKL